MSNEVPFNYKRATAVLGTTLFVTLVIVVYCFKSMDRYLETEFKRNTILKEQVAMLEKQLVAVQKH